MSKIYPACQYQSRTLCSSCVYKRYIKTAILLLAVFFISVSIAFAENVPAAQNYSEISEQYHILTSAWQLNEIAKEDEQLKIKHNGKDYVWKVDLALLAKRLDPNSAVSGSTDFTRDYLSKLGQLPPQSEVIIELVNSQKGAPLVVAGIGLYDSDKQWQHATKFGSRTLNLSAEKVKELGSAEKYHKKVLQYCDQEWTKIKARREL
jgi:hypothetical protein